jgi:uncharacterized membrane-anchored protein YhcB (DUF1043 family)
MENTKELELFKYYQKKSIELELSNLILQMKHADELQIQKEAFQKELEKIRNKFEEDKENLIKNFTKKNNTVEKKTRTIKKKAEKLNDSRSTGK